MKPRVRRHFWLWRTGRERPASLRTSLRDQPRRLPVRQAEPVSWRNVNHTEIIVDFSLTKGVL